jgi:hypothetical protein
MLMVALPEPTEMNGNFAKQLEIKDRVQVGKNY